MKKIGYVLSGGGARGFAHLGVIRLLEELGIQPFAIAGTSVGAVAGASYAAGKKPEEILQLMKKKYLGLRSIAWQKEGFFSMGYIKVLNGERLRIPFSVLFTCEPIITSHILMR